MSDDATETEFEMPTPASDPAFYLVIEKKTNRVIDRRLPADKGAALPKNSIIAAVQPGGWRSLPDGTAEKWPADA